MKLYIFGAGSNTYGLMKFFENHEIINLIDNDMEKKGKIINNIEVIDFDTFNKKYDNEMIIISVLNDRFKIVEQIESVGIKNYYFAPPMIEAYFDATKVVEYIREQNKKIVFSEINPWTVEYLRLIEEGELLHLVKGVLKKSKGEEQLQIQGIHLRNIDNNEIDNEDLIVKVSDKKLDFSDNQMIDIYRYSLKSSLLKENDCSNLENFKNLYSHEKCFIIGNGPSLKKEDLECVNKNNIASFGCNRIYKIFDEVNWRPDYYFLGDMKMIDGIKDVISSSFYKKNFFTRTYYNDILGNYNLKRLRYNLIRTEAEDYFSGYDNNITEGVYNGYSVSVEMLQFAIYMGFSEIYLLGMDFSYIDAKKGNQHFYQNEAVDQYNASLIQNLYQDKLLRAYEHINAYAKRNGIKIYNATRGGYLEVFERCNFDQIIAKEMLK